MKRLLLSLVALCALMTASAQVSIERPYAVGADISWLQWQEDSGITFSDEGVEGDALALLRDNGFNYIRLRLFVNPRSELGYSQRDGYCDLEHTLAMAKRIKEAGMYFLLDFHSSAWPPRATWSIISAAGAYSLTARTPSLRSPQRPAKL